ncbi:MAG: pectate lyase [Ferruginibacter sp.]
MVLNFKRNLLLTVLAVVFLSARLSALPVIVVAQDGSGDFKTIQEAINSLPADATAQRIIEIRKGTYQEKIFIDKNFVTLRGENPRQTIVTISLARDEWRCENKDDYGTATVNLKGSDITLENISFINSYGKDATTNKTMPCKKDSSGYKTFAPNAHQMALRSFNTTRLIVINCIFRAYGGDTVSPWNTKDGMFYFKDCIMEGGVDFYCPRGWALADNCTFICQASPAAIWHDGSGAESSKTVLLNCKFTGVDGFLLGRYHKDAQFYLLHCSFGKNMADKDIYLVPTNNTIQWGRRVYYYNCHREQGDYSWFKDNLPDGFGINDMNIPWVYDYKWDPLTTVRNTNKTAAVELDNNHPGKDIVAENMLLYQRRNGGWPKHFQKVAVDYKHNLTPSELNELKEGYNESIDATIDNNATTKEILYLAKAYKKSNNKRYLEAVKKGIDYLLLAQYSNGGWPQYYPDKSSYRSQVTYNDNAMVNVLNLLQDVVEDKEDLDIAGAAYKLKCEKAIQKGIQCILKTQVKQRGVLTAWCAQYDYPSLKPAKARAFELISLSGGESVNIVRFLMRQDKPTKEMKAAVIAAINWFEKVKIVGYNFIWIAAPGTPKGRDKVFVPDSTSTIWARFYNIETNEPFFCGRDGIARKTVAEIEYERRTGYAWYGSWPQQLLAKEYPAWCKKWGVK